FAVFAVLVFAALVAACGGGGTSNSPAASSGSSPAASGGAAQSKTANIGVGFSLTGPAAGCGATQKNGGRPRAGEINSSGFIPGVKLSLMQDDDASDKAQGISVYQKFINQDKVAAIIGPTLTNTAVAADPVAQAAKVPVLAVSNTGTGITSIGDYIL